LDEQRRCEGRHAQRSRGSQVDARDAIESGQRVHRHRDHAEHGADRDQRRAVESEHRDQQRVENEGRNGVVRGEQRVDDAPQTRHGVEQNADDEAGDDGDHDGSGSVG
jgi:hypothetical protein